MNQATIEAFVDELQSISKFEKDAGIKDTLKAGASALKKVPGAVNQVALKSRAAIGTHPVGQLAAKGFQHVMNPMNHADLGGTLSNVARFLGH